MARRRTTPARAFLHRAGVRISGTHITCDAAGSAEDLVFLSHAQAVGAPGRRRFPLRRAGRQELLATEETLALLGPAGQTLRKHALPAPFGRAFVLGDLRVELVASGHLPGAASLLCEVESRRLLYAGTVRREAPALGAAPCVVRRADAVCIDGTFGDPRFDFPPRDEALAAVRAFASEALAAGKTPVVLAPVYGAAMDVADALARKGIALRGHRAMLVAAAAFRAAGVPVPLIARFDRKVGPREALLWPPEAREAPLLNTLASPAFAFVSGFSVDPDIRARMRADAGIPLSNQSGYRDLLAYLEATGAREVAVVRGFSESFAEDLRRRGYDAYPLGPPRQMELFRG
ncbi:MAG TPA: hypothetical protein VN914_09265 [Polyangia bacterium]|nr:hypothetical protein [Polyangia bacterium]